MEIVVDEERGTHLDVKFRHERLEDEEGNFKQMGGRTVAYLLTIEGETIETYAECSVKDTYSKKLGRVIACGRLLKSLGLPTRSALKI